MSTRFWAVASAFALTAALGTGAYFTLLKPGQHSCGPTNIAGGEAAIGGTFELVSHTGQTMTEADVIQDLTLIYFGYTFCPDVCPLDVARNITAVEIAAEKGIKIRPVFVTIDPARDTQEVLAEYSEIFHPDMISLRGTDDQIKVASRAYKTYYRKNGEGDDYLMDHSAFTYFMSPDGFLDVFRRELTPEQVAERMVCHANA